MHINYLPDTPDTQAAVKAIRVLWVPSEKVVSHLVPKPTAPKRKWLELIPWLLEERLLEKAADIHFVITGETKDSNLEVLAVNKRDMDKWQGLARDAQVNPSAFLPDYLALPWFEDRISIAQRDNILLVRLGMQAGFAAEVKNAYAMIELILQQDSQNSEIQLSQNITLDSLPDSLQALVKNRFELDWHLASAVSEASLLTGDYRLQTSGRGLKKWWPIAAVLLLGLGFWFWYFNSSVASQTIQPLAERQSDLPEQSNISPSVQVSNDVSQSTMPPPTPRRRSNFSAELLGIVINGEVSSATIKINSQPERVIHLKEELSQGISVHTISSNKIVIDDHGELIELSLKKYDSVIQANNASSVQAIDNNEGFALANMFAVVPVQVDNYDAGLKLDNLSEELRQLADISEGDIVVQVGGSSIQELMSNPALWTTFSTNTELPVTIIRSGEEMIIDVNAFSLSASVLPNLASGIMP